MEPDLLKIAARRKNVAMVNVHTLVQNLTGPTRLVVYHSAIKGLRIGHILIRVLFHI